MALDESTENDKTYTVDNLNFLIDEYDRSIIEEYGGVEIDHSNAYGMSRFSVYLSRAGRC